MQSKCWSQKASVWIQCKSEAQRNIPLWQEEIKFSASSSTEIRSQNGLKTNFGHLFYYLPPFDVVLQYISSSCASQSTTPLQTWCRSRHKFPHSKQLFFIWFNLSSETFISSAATSDFFTRFNAFSHLHKHNIINYKKTLPFSWQYCILSITYLKASVSIRKQTCEFKIHNPPHPVGSKGSWILWQTGMSSVKATQTSRLVSQLSQYLTCSTE